jgi:hypothetical protein
LIEQSSLGEDTFDPDLLERFTIFSSRVFLNSIAEFKLSLLSSGTSRFWKKEAPSLKTLEYAICGLLLPWTGPMNKIYVAQARKLENKKIRSRGNRNQPNNMSEADIFETIYCEQTYLSMWSSSHLKFI